MSRIDRSNSARYWNSARVPDLSLMAADFTTQVYRPHSHEALVVAVTEWGGSEVSTRGAVEQARSSAVLVFNPGEPHWGRMAGWKRWRYRAFYLGRAGMDALAEGLGIRTFPYFRRNLIDDRDLVSRFLMLHDTLERVGDPLKATELFYDTFGNLLNRQGRQDSQFPPAPVDANVLGEVIEFLRLHYVESISLNAVARRFRQTPFQLIRSFKKLTGLTPYAYLTQVRLKAACSLLRQGEAIASIAPAVGLYDQSALTRCFKRTLGITPLQFVEAAGTRHCGRREKGAIGVRRPGISTALTVPQSGRFLPGDSMLRSRNT